MHDELVHVSLLFAEAGDAITASFRGAEFDFKERVVLCSYYREVEGHREGGGRGIESVFGVRDLQRDIHVTGRIVRELSTTTFKALRPNTSVIMFGPFKLTNPLSVGLLWWTIPFPLLAHS